MQQRFIAHSESTLELGDPRGLVSSLWWLSAGLLFHVLNLGTVDSSGQIVLCFRGLSYSW